LRHPFGWRKHKQGVFIYLDIQVDIKYLVNLGDALSKSGGVPYRSFFIFPANLHATYKKGCQNMTAFFLLKIEFKSSDFSVSLFFQSGYIACI
jgi:hypothetical protein